MTDLKPCPFCGEPAIRKDTSNHLWLDVKCGCLARGLPGIEQWNSRPIEDRLRAALERVCSEARHDDASLSAIATICGEALK